MIESSSRRALAVDALRGIAILLMIFSGRIPFGVLPEWMYHAQVPPPLHKFDPTIPGITWVDLVFPFFLFSMGAAIPLALSRRLNAGSPLPSVIRGILARGALLAAFAIYVQHIRPWGMSKEPGAVIWVQCLAGFLLLFPMIARLPDSWNAVKKWTVRVTGWGGAIALMSAVSFSDGTGFSVQRSDIIILVLANVAVAGGLIWIFTREHVHARIIILGILLGLRLASAGEGWVQWVWNISPVPWLFQVRFLQYLFIVIPGTIVGDMLLRWMNEHPAEPAPSWGRWQYGTLAFLAIATNVMVTVGLMERYVAGTIIASAGIAVAMCFLSRKPSTTNERLLSGLCRTGMLLLFIGFVFEPYEGGIRKDHATMSYYFVTGGLATLLLAGLSIAIDVARKQKAFALLIATGQNPLVAYAGVNSFLPPLLGLFALDGVIARVTATPWLGVVRGAIMTLTMAYVAAWCTKREIYLKT